MRDAASPPGASCDPQHPWVPSEMPVLRPGPPFLMAEAIGLEPELAGRIAADVVAAGTARGLASLLRTPGTPRAPAGTTGVRPPGPLAAAVVGCGTSEHAAMAAALIWQDAVRRAGLPGPWPVARQALEAALDPWPTPAIGISHEGGTEATNAALRAARSCGAPVGIITAAANSPGAALASTCLCTGQLDLSWCHTIGYLSPIVAAAAVGAELAGGAHPDPGSVAALVAAGPDREEAAARIGRGLGASAELVVTATGADVPAGRELTLKVEEASYLPARYRDLETMLHGHLAAMDRTSSLVLLLTDRTAVAVRAARARQVLGAAAAIGTPAAAILSATAAAAVPDELTPLGRVVVPEAVDLPAPVAALLGSAVPLQLVTYHLALARGTNPDGLRREHRPYRDAAAIAEPAAFEVDAE